jgi:hypothetical protein
VQETQGDRFQILKNSGIKRLRDEETQILRGSEIKRLKREVVRGWWTPTVHHPTGREVQETTPRQNLGTIGT